MNCLVFAESQNPKECSDGFCSLKYLEIGDASIEKGYKLVQHSAPMAYPEKITYCRAHNIVRFRLAHHGLQFTAHYVQLVDSGSEKLGPAVSQDNNRRAPGKRDCHTRRS